MTNFCFQKNKNTRNNMEQGFYLQANTYQNVTFFDLTIPFLRFSPSETGNHIHVYQQGTGKIGHNTKKYYSTIKKNELQCLLQIELYNPHPDQNAMKS